MITYTYYLFPVSNASVQLSPSGATYNYDCVNDGTQSDPSIKDNGTTVVMGGEEKVDRYNLTSWPTEKEGVRIISVQFFCASRPDSSGYVRSQFGPYINGNYYNLADGGTDAYNYTWTSSNVFTVNPATGEEWTITDLNSLQFFLIHSGTSKDNAKTTACYVKVIYSDFYFAYDTSWNIKKYELESTWQTKWRSLKTLLSRAVTIESLDLIDKYGSWAQVSDDIFHVAGACAFWLDGAMIFGDYRILVYWGSDDSSFAAYQNHTICCSITKISTGEKIADGAILSESISAENVSHMRVSYVIDNDGYLWVFVLDSAWDYYKSDYPVNSSNFIGSYNEDMKRYYVNATRYVIPSGISSGAGPLYSQSAFIAKNGDIFLIAPKHSEITFVHYDITTQTWNSTDQQFEDNGATLMAHCTTGRVCRECPDDSEGITYFVAVFTVHYNSSPSWSPVTGNLYFVFGVKVQYNHSTDTWSFISPLNGNTYSQLDGNEEYFVLGHAGWSTNMAALTQMSDGTYVGIMQGYLFDYNGGYVNVENPDNQNGVAGFVIENGIPTYKQLFPCYTNGTDDFDGTPSWEDYTRRSLGLYDSYYFTQDYYYDGIWWGYMYNRAYHARIIPVSSNIVVAVISQYASHQMIRKPYFEGIDIFVSYNKGQTWIAYHNFIQTAVWPALCPIPADPDRFYISYAQAFNALKPDEITNPHLTMEGLTGITQALIMGELIVSDQLITHINDEPLEAINTVEETELHLIRRINR